MQTLITLPQNVSASSPLGALVAHFNASTKGVQRTFAKLISDYVAREGEQKLLEKIERGEKAIRDGHGISQKPDETDQDFFERLCTL